MPVDGRRSTYYVDGFERILDTVLSRYADLLTVEERAFAVKVRRLGIEARCLYIRLLSRVGPYFRRADLRYDEIADIDRAIDELVANDLLELDPAAAPAALLPHLLRSEIEAIGASFGLGVTRGTKSRWIDTLVDACDAASTSPATVPQRSRIALADLCAAIRERVPLVAPLGLELVKLYRLLFFGNLRQDWTELLLADLGVWRYEAYPLRRDLRLFATRAAIDDALAIRRLADRARERLAAGDAAGAWAIAVEVARRQRVWEPSSAPGARARSPPASPRSRPAPGRRRFSSRYGKRSAASATVWCRGGTASRDTSSSHWSACAGRNWRRCSTG